MQCPVQRNIDKTRNSKPEKLGQIAIDPMRDEYLRGSPVDNKERGRQQ